MKKQPRSSQETLITPWLFFRYMAIGIYVGAATVGGAAYWFLYDPSGPQINYYQLSHFLQCHSEPEKFKGISCELFQVNVGVVFD
jgi:Ca2+ transporting ATPase